MKELRILCLAVVVVAGILNAGAAVFAGQHQASRVDRLAANP